MFLQDVSIEGLEALQGAYGGISKCSLTRQSHNTGDNMIYNATPLITFSV